MTRKNYSISKEHAYELGLFALNITASKKKSVSKQSILEALIDLARKDGSVYKKMVRFIDTSHK